MPKTPPKKTKARKNPKQAAAERTKKHDLIIQDLIAGLSTSDISKTHGVSIATVCTVNRDNKDRIEEGVNKRLAEREEAINQAFEQERERISRMISKSGKLMEEALDKALKMMETGERQLKEVTEETGPDGKKTREKSAPITLSDIESLFKTIRSVLMQYQREADGAQPS